MMRARVKRKPMSEINVVPYIDVMLVLLIIFMITAPLLSQGVKVNLPKAAAKALATKEKTPIIVSIDAKGKYYLNIAQNPQLPITDQELISEISTQIAAEKANNSARQVLVKGDANVNYGRVVEVMVLLQHAGVPRVGLMTEDLRTHE